MSQNTAEPDMNLLSSATILRACGWSDPDFVNGYHRVLGAVIAAKNPLTISALNALHSDQPVTSSLVLRQLAPLLTGLDQGDEQTVPMQLLDQSLRDFLMQGAAVMPGHQMLAVNEKEHNRTLAVLCLEFMVHNLNEGSPGVGFLATDEETQPGVPELVDDITTKALTYSCQFWIPHLLEADPTDSAVSEALAAFLSTKLVLWMEATASRGTFQGIAEVSSWVQVRMIRFSELNN